MSVIFVPLANTFRCELIFIMHSQVIENVYHVLSGDGVTEADAQRIAAKFKTWWSANGRVVASGTISLQRIEVIDASQQDGVGIVYTTGLPQVGAGSASVLPNNVTVAVKWSTGFTGRSFRGRTFLCGIYPEAIAGNQINPTAQTAIQTAYAALITTLSGGGTNDTLVVGSKKHAGVWRDEGVVTPILNASVDLNLDSQRRRLTGTGRGN